MSLIRLTQRKRKENDISLTPLIPPRHLHLIRPEPLSERTLLQPRPLPHPKLQQTRLRNHQPIIDTEPLIRRIALPPTFLSHDVHHTLETLVASDAADDEDFGGSNVGEGAFGDLDEHGEDVFLEGETEV